MSREVELTSADFLVPVGRNAGMVFGIGDVAVVAAQDSTAPTDAGDSLRVLNCHAFIREPAVERETGRARSIMQDQTSLVCEHEPNPRATYHEIVSSLVSY